MSEAGRGMPRAGFVPIAALLAELCVASPSYAQSPPSPITCLFVGNNVGANGAPGGRIDALLSSSGWLSGGGGPASAPLPLTSMPVPQGPVQQLLIRDHTLLALTSTALVSYDISSTCGLLQVSSMPIDPVGSMALAGSTVYVSSSTTNALTTVLIDPSGNLSLPTVATLWRSFPVRPIAIAAAAPMVYTFGQNWCTFPVQASGLLGSPSCTSPFATPQSPATLLVSGNVLYSLFNASLFNGSFGGFLRASSIDPIRGTLTPIDAFPPTTAFDDIMFNLEGRAMAAWPDGSVVFVALHGGIASVGAPTATQPHTALGQEPLLGNTVALATDPTEPYLYAADAAQGRVYSIPVSGGSALSMANGGCILNGALTYNSTMPVSQCFTIPVPPTPTPSASGGSAFSIPGQPVSLVTWFYQPPAKPPKPPKSILPLPGDSGL